MMSSPSLFFFPCPSIRCSAAVVYLRSGLWILAIYALRRRPSNSARIDRDVAVAVALSSHALIFYSLILFIYSFLSCVPVTDCSLHVEPVRLSRYLPPLLLFANFAVALSPSLCQRNAPAAMKILNRRTLTRASRCRQRLRRRGEARRPCQDRRQDHPSHHQAQCRAPGPPGPCEDWWQPPW